jgi:Tfp pilus assembly protein PilF
MRVRALALTPRLFVLGAASAAPRLSQDAVGRNTVGVELLRRGDTEEAIQKFEQVLKRDPVNATREIEVQAEYGPVTRWGMPCST